MDTLYDSLEALVEEWSPEGTHGWDLEYSVRSLSPLLSSSSIFHPVSPHFSSLMVSLCERSLIARPPQSGVLTLNIGPHGTYVINKQPPNQQIWMSSPFSGPARFSYVPEVEGEGAQEGKEGARWFYSRDGVTLGHVLDQEIRSVLVAEVGERDAQAWHGPGVP
jgi:frataxin